MNNIRSKESLPFRETNKAKLTERIVRWPPFACVL